MYLCWRASRSGRQRWKVDCYSRKIAGSCDGCNVEPSPSACDEQDGDDGNEERYQDIEQVIHVRICDERCERNYDQRTDCFESATNVNWAVGWAFVVQQAVSAGFYFILVIVVCFAFNVLLLQAFLNIITLETIERMVKASEPSYVEPVRRASGLHDLREQQEVPREHADALLSSFSFCTWLAIPTKRTFKEEISIREGFS